MIVQLQYITAFWYSYYSFGKFQKSVLSVDCSLLQRKTEAIQLKTTRRWNQHQKSPDYRLNSEPTKITWPDIKSNKKKMAAWCCGDMRLPIGAGILQAAFIILFGCFVRYDEKLGMPVTIATATTAQSAMTSSTMASANTSSNTISTSSHETETTLHHIEQFYASMFLQYRYNFVSKNLKIRRILVTSNA